MIENEIESNGTGEGRAFQRGLDFGARGRVARVDRKEKGENKEEEFEMG